MKSFVENDANIYSFIIGIFIFFSLGIGLVVGNTSWINIIGCPWGAFMILQHGWIKDNSKWKLSPLKILLICFSIVAIVIIILFSSRNNKKDIDLNTLNTLEIDIKKPEGWYSMNLSQDQRIEDLKSGGFNADQLDKIIETTKGTLPLFSYTKYHIDSVDVPIPTINVSLVKNYTSNFEEFLDRMDYSTKQLQDMFNNFEITSPIQEIDIAGFKSISFVATYDLPFYDSIYKTRIRVYAVPIDSYFYQINFIDYIESEDCSILYNDLLKSIRIGEN
jgi:hypothetical protein